ncbi:MAG TPA: hypothetical protein VGC69_08055 [Bordetella sp.]
MTVIASLGQTTLAASVPVPSSLPAASSLAQTGSVPSPTPSSSTTVTLSQANPAPALVYLPPPAQPVWETQSADAATKLMAQNFSASTLAGRLQGLGQTLLEQLGGGGGDFSQSVYLPTGNAVPSSALKSVTQSILHTSADNQISLDVTTRSGATVQITLDSQGNGLAAAVTVTGGTLTDADRSALLKLAGGFQDAIDGLTADPPALNLDGLVQFDPTVLASVDLHASVDVSGQGAQTVDFHADDQQRSVKASGPLGTVQVNVDMSNPTLLGSADQQARALGNYLQQFDAARSRGDGNAELMSMFSDAFKALNSHYAVNPAQPAASQSITLGDTDRSMLTGLADFSASITQANQSLNPMKPGEVDGFAYQVSQHTAIQAGGRLNYTVNQTQQSQLHASFHRTLQPGDTLSLTGDKQSQNYYYYQIDDSAQSQATIAYAKGKLVQATLNQSASESTRVQKYVMGDLEADTTTPYQQAWSQNLLDLLDSSQQSSPGMSSQANRQALLSRINDLVALPSSPGQLADKQPAR